MVEKDEKVLVVEPKDEIGNESMTSEPPKDKTEEVCATSSSASTPAKASPPKTSSSRENDFYKQYYSRFRRYWLIVQKCQFLALLVFFKNMYLVIFSDTLVFRFNNKDLDQKGMNGFMLN